MARFSFAATMGLCVFLAQAASSADGAGAPAALKGRPGLAIKMDVEGKQAKLIVALNYLEGADDVPLFQGVRFYTYSVPVAGIPTQIGWKSEKGSQVVLVRGKKHSYFKGDIDRQENGSVSIAQMGKADKYRVVGVYHYMGQLFIIDSILKSGEPLLLYERAAAD